MGTCYSKTGQEIDQDSEKRPKERRKGSQKNGHSKSLKNPRLVIDIPIQRDLSDTVYTEDSHFCIADEANCINKSMQTSLNNLNRDANKNIEALTGCEIMEQSDCVVINDKSKWKSNNTQSAQNVQKEIVKNLELRDGKVSTSDSGIVVEGCKSCEGVEENSEVNDKCPENLETRMDSFDQACENCGCESEEPEHTGNAKCSCNHTNTTYCDSHRHSVLTEHSNSCSCHEGDNRESVASIDRLSESFKRTESPADLDKIRLAIRQNSLGTPTEHRSSIFDGSEISYDLSSAISQPEVTTMMMNGREVVVIDSESFSQIMDEIRNLKMKLSQLTEVIQDADEEDVEADDEDVEDMLASMSILSASASST